MLTMWTALVVGVLLAGANLGGRNDW